MSHLGHNGSSFGKKCYRRARPVSPQAKLRIKAEFGARFGDGDHSVVIGDVVDAASAARKRKTRALRCGIDVQTWLAGWPLVPRAWSIEEAIAQDEAIEALRAEHLVFHIGGAFDRDRPLRVRKVERSRLPMRLAAACIAKGDALHDEAPRRCSLRRRNQVACAFAADACIRRV